MDKYRKSQHSRDKGLVYVLQSLTATCKDVLKIVAQYQLNHPNEYGITLDVLFEETEKGMLTSNMSILKSFMQDNIENNLIRVKEESDGKNHYYMNYPNSTLEKQVKGIL
jgi:hypothetical protein